MTNIFKISEQIQTLTDSLWDELLKCKYQVYTQDDYPRLKKRDSNVGYMLHTSTVYADNTNNDYCYTTLYSNSLIDAVVHMGNSGCIVLRIGSEYANVHRICSFVRKNADTLRNHTGSEKLQELLATCREENLQLVKQLIK